MMMCQKLGCYRDATHTVVINAPVRGYAEDDACPGHAESARNQIYVREVYRRDGGDEA